MYQPEGLAEIIFKDRYASHKEETFEEACDRIALCAARAEENGKFVVWKERFKDILVEGKFCPGGRIWYGAGRPKQQLLNCFVIPAEDSREGWGKSVSDMIVISGLGGGVGINGSKIRPRGTKIHGTGGEATGAVSFFEIINSAGQVIKGGGGRRTALMLCLDMVHPDVVEFIDKKFTKVQRDSTNPEEIMEFVKKEFELYSLTDEMRNSIEAFCSQKEGAGEHWKNFINGLSDIFLQQKLKNANVSVVFSTDPEEFFEKVRNDEEWELKWQEEVISKVSAKDLWNKIISNFLEGGEPGILNRFLANKMNNIYYCNELVSTNPCITGDTLIAVADGRNAVSIKQLMMEKKDVPVYSTNLETGQVEIKMGRNPRKTGIKKEIWKLTLDDGTFLRATPDHKILKKNLEYVELKDLVSGDSIFPFNSFDSNGYRQITNVGQKMIGGARRNRRQYRLIHEFYNGKIDAKKYAIHHSDFNSKNDKIENLKVMLHEDHRTLHSENMKGEKNPYHKMSDEWKKEFASHPGESNGRYSGISNKELIEHGKFLFERDGKISQSSWIDYAKANNLPQFLGNEFRFKTFTNFKNQVSTNHKVVSVEFCGYEDVYNITVDDNHNYHVITSKEDENYIQSSGICVKNCGEIWLAKYGCCDLGAIVLSRLLNEDRTDFDWDSLADVVTAGVRFLDNILTVNNYPLPEIAQHCQEVRRIGLGVMALHDSLLMMGIKYSSEEGLKKIDELFEFIKNKAYEASTYLAVEKGVFPKFDKTQFLKSGFVKGLKRSVRSKIKEYGMRNCALLTIAPTGTTSILMGSPSSGIEPIFAPAWWRIFYAPDGSKRRELVFHPLFKEMQETGKSLEHFESAYFISPEQHMQVQAICQKHIDNAVSKTINIPESGYDLDQFSDLLMKYIPQLKGCTVYKAGSRGDEPLKAIDIDEALTLLDQEGRSEVDADQLMKQACPDGICLI